LANGFATGDRGVEKRHQSLLTSSLYIQSSQDTAEYHNKN
jgi:hypothetical protein